MCSATCLAVKESPIHYRQLQHQVIALLKENLLLRNQCYSVKFTLLPLALQDLDWWIHNLSTSISNPIILPPPDIYIQTDLGSGGYLKPLRTLGVDKEPTFLAHKQKGIDGNFSRSKVFPKIPRECPYSNNDRQLNKCVLSEPYGRNKISHSFKSGTRHLEMVPMKAIHISAAHVAGLLNNFADPLSHFKLLSTEWMLCKRIF